MKQLISSLMNTVQSGGQAVLCSVLQASGSTPRGAGAHMAVFADGHTEGSVGGGAVELTVIQRAAELLHHGGSCLVEYHLRPNEVADLGMVCGGDVTVLLQAWTPAQLPLLTAMDTALSGRENVWWLVELREKQVAQMGIYTPSTGLQVAELEEEQRASLCRSRPVLESRGEALWYAEPIQRTGMVYIFGAGHVSQALVPILRSVDFPVTVYDPRSELADPARFPQAEHIICGDFTEIGKHLTVTADDYVIIMTPGHEADREVLAQMLRTEATYVGLIGSRRKIASTRAYLEGLGFAPEVWDRVHAPIGIPIGSDTPAEIAISITAELIDHRSKL